jgi:hypothetical protein
MSSGQSDKSHQTGWVLSILGVVILYFLSVPPVLFLAWNYSVKAGSVTGAPPVWASTYATPYWLLSKKGMPWEKAMHGYMNWWSKLIYGVP